MADKLSKKDRSKLMAKVSQKGTKPEMIVRKFLYKNGFRYRLNVKKFPGSPDILMRKRMIAIFVHGCYWHGHSCRAGRLPSTNLNYWEKKIADNKERDKRKNDQLIEMGYHVIEVWGCELKTISKRDERLSRLIDEINQFRKCT